MPDQVYEPEVTEMVPANETAPLAEVESRALAMQQVGQFAVLSQVARVNPRNELIAFNRIIDALKRKTLAAKARYSYPRGGTNVSGPSVYLARVIAMYWGNISVGFRVVKETSTQVTIVAEAYDAETGGHRQQGVIINKAVQRKVKRGGQTVTEWVQPDERELREMINRHGAILERNLMLKLVPPDFIEDALDQASDTLAKSIKNPKDEIKKLVLSFSNGGITLEMLETYLGRSSDEWGGEEIVELTGIYNALKDGQAKKEHYWPKKPAEADQTGDPPSSGVQAMKEKTAQKASALKSAPEGRDNEADPALFT